MSAERLAYQARIVQPDWDFYELHLQRSVPSALRELYADRALVTALSLDYSDDIGISTFEVLDEQNLLDTRQQVGCEIVAFATSDCGDPIYLRPGAAEPDTVYIMHHDGGDTEVLAGSPSVMLAKLRQANHTAEQSAQLNGHQPAAGDRQSA